MDIKPFFELVKLKQRHWIIIFSVLLIITLIPTGIKETLGIRDIYQRYRTLFSFGMIISGVTSLVKTVEYFYDWLKRLWKKRRFESGVKDKLHSLSTTEKNVCREAFKKDGLINLEIDSGLGSYLISHRILIRCANVSVVGTLFAYRLSEFAYDYLKDNPGLLDHID